MRKLVLFILLVSNLAWAVGDERHWISTGPAGPGGPSGPTYDGGGPSGNNGGGDMHPGRGGGPTQPGAGPNAGSQGNGGGNNNNNNNAQEERERRERQEQIRQSRVLFHERQRTDRAGHAKDFQAVMERGRIHEEKEAKREKARLAQAEAVRKSEESRKKKSKENHLIKVRANLEAQEQHRHDRDRHKGEACRRDREALELVLQTQQLEHAAQEAIRIAKQPELDSAQRDIQNFRAPDPVIRRELQDQYMSLARLSPTQLFQRESKEFGLVTTQYSDSQYTYGDADMGEFYMDMGKSFLDLAVGLDPVTGVGRSAYEFMTGKNLITQEQLGDVERSLAFVGLATANGSKYIHKAGQGMNLIYHEANRILNNPGFRTALDRGRHWVENSGLARWKPSHKITRFETAADANHRLEDAYRAAGRGGVPLPPFQEGSFVTHFVTTEDQRFIRVHTEGNQVSNWVVREGEVRGLTPLEIQNKLNLPTPPTHMSEVHVPNGTPMSRSKTQLNIWDEALTAEGQVQYRLEAEHVPPEWFQNARPL